MRENTAIFDENTQSGKFIETKRTAMLKIFETISPLSESASEALSKSIQTIHVKKKEILLEPDNISKSLYFVVKGGLRSYYLMDGKEITSMFAFENDLITSIRSFFSQLPSFETIQAMEKSELNVLSYDCLQKLYRDYHEISELGRKMVEAHYQHTEEYVTALHFRSAQQRYVYLLERYPNIIQKASSKHIATYLGISQETLSRIKSNR